MQKAKELGIVSKKDITYGLLEEKGGNLSITTGEEKMEKHIFKSFIMGLKQKVSTD